MLGLKLPQLALGLLLLAASTSAFWRLPCASPIVVERSDPIANSGDLSGHVHTIMGGNGFGFQLDYNGTQASTCSSCKAIQDKSNYWVPTVYYKSEDGKNFTSVKQVGGALVYYLQRSDKRDHSYPNLTAFPAEFRMLAGNPNLRSYNGSVEQNAISFACIGTNTKQTNGFPNIKCPGGLRSQVFFPSCWDGVNFDSDDHKSHVGYPSGGSYDSGYCDPVKWPKRLISIFYEVMWDTSPFDNMWYGDGQPFVLSNGDPTGYGYHGDFVNGWNVTTLQKAVDNCTADSGVIEECQYFDLRSDDDEKMCVVPTSVNETVFGSMPTLPGCNPVQSGPANAVPQSGCGAVTMASAPQLPYVDLTTSKGFKYLGCGLDLAGQPRTLQGADNSSDTGMTVETCVDFCVKKGFSVAGIEYAKQCFCDNSVPADRAPIPGLARDCSMPCTGDSKEICGGPAMISLYQKCGTGDCQNADITFLNGSSSTGGNKPSVPSGAASLSYSSGTSTAAGSSAAKSSTTAGSSSTSTTSTTTSSTTSSTLTSSTSNSFTTSTLTSSQSSQMHQHVVAFTRDHSSAKATHTHS